MRAVARAVLAVAVFVAAPHVGAAQELGSIAGVVRVTSGGVLPANLDLLNAFNSDAVLAYTPVYSGANGGTWLRPTTLVQGRIIKFGIRWGF